jgi:hypothetical protein
MVRYGMVGFAVAVLLGASLFPDDAFARRGGGGYRGGGGFHGGGARVAHVRGGAVHAGRVGVAGRGYGYRPIPGRPVARAAVRRGAYRTAYRGAYRGAAYGAAAVGAAAAGAAYYNGYYNRCYYDAYVQWICPPYQY